MLTKSYITGEASVLAMSCLFSVNFTHDCISVQSTMKVIYLQAVVSGFYDEPIKRDLCGWVPHEENNLIGG